MVEPWWRRRRSRWLVTLLALLAGPFVCEVGLRWFLFSGSPLAARVGRRFRDARLYVPTTDCDDYHELHYLISLPKPRQTSCVPHAELGWISPAFDPAGLRHPDEERIQGRRPVLLYGSSYASCWFPVQDCFQQLLEASELAPRFCLLNYGTPAYGLDQALMLASKTVARFAEKKPVVVLAFVVEEDLPRAQLAFFQSPKPRFVKRAGTYELCLPDTIDPLEFIARHPPHITSYLARYLTCGARLLPPPVTGLCYDRLQETEERLGVTLYLLHRFHSELAALELEHFFFLLHSPRAFPPRAPPYADGPKLLALLEQGRVPHVDTFRFFEAERLRAGGDLSALYLDQGLPHEWHPNQHGTEVLFAALELGLQGHYD